LKSIQEKHLAEFLKENGIVKFLGSHIDQNRYPFESAVIKFLLGIYEEKLLDRPSKLDLGRYYLRIGWLFRTNKDRLKNSTGAASAYLSNLRKTAEQAGILLNEYESKLKDIQTGFGAEYEMIYGQSEQAGKLKEQAQSTILNLLNTVSPLHKLNESIINRIDENASALAPADTSSEGFFNYSSFTDYLEKARRLWSEVPVNEMEALIKARDYYQAAYETGDKISAGVGQIQAAYLIAELSRRTGNYANAGVFFNHVIKSGREIINGRKEDSSTINSLKNC
jgi:hypothetical protein